MEGCSSKKVALITGCSSGIGLELSIKLAKHGHRVYASMRNPTARSHHLKHRASEAGVPIGDDIVITRLDVQDVTSIQAAVDGLMSSEGRIDVLVNNAGVNITGALEAHDPQDMRRCVEVNAVGVMLVTRYVLPHMKARRSGIIVNVSALGGLVATPFSEVWCASKFAVEGFSESLAQVARHFNIRVCVVEPGPTYHPHLPALRVDTDGADQHTVDLLQRFQSRMGGSGSGTVKTAEDVASSIADAIASGDPPFRLFTHPAYLPDIRVKYTDPEGSTLMTQLSERYLGPTSEGATL